VLYANGLTTIGDDANSNMSVGLTINQGAADNEILALKSSDVDHGMTTVTETDTFGQFVKGSAAGGGLAIKGFDDGGGLTSGAVQLWGILGQAADTTHTAAGFGIVRLVAQIKNGTGVTDPGANANLFSIDGNGATRFIVDQEGNFFSDDTGATYDGWDDLALVHAFDLRRDFGQWRGANRDTLIAAGILAPDDAHGNRGFVNWTNLARLHNGALRQAYALLEQATARIQALEARLVALEAGGE